MLLIEMWGPPGVGKSTMALGLVHWLRVNTTKRIELITEYAKDVYFDTAQAIGRDGNAIATAMGRRQMHLMEEQYRRITRLLGQTDIAVADTALGLNEVYRDVYLYPLEAWRVIIRAHYRALGCDLLHVLLSRPESAPYCQDGRSQDEEQSAMLAHRIESALGRTPGRVIRVGRDMQAVIDYLQKYGVA